MQILLDNVIDVHTLSAIDSVLGDLRYLEDGRELVLCKRGGEERIKLAKNSLILYPSSYVHCIAKVDSGRRHAAVGWLQSRIRCADYREILFDLSPSLGSLSDTAEGQCIHLRLPKAKSNLMRLWANRACSLVPSCGEWPANLRATGGGCSTLWTPECFMSNYSFVTLRLFICRSKPYPIYCF